MKRMLVLFLVVLAFSMPVAVFAQQEVCPHSEGWTKEDGVNAPSFDIEVPAGKTLVEWCYKASTELEFSGAISIEGPATVTITSSVENDNGQTQNISHVTYRLVDTEDECEGDECCEPNCNPPCEGEECCEGRDCEPECEVDCEPETPTCESDCDDTPPPSGPQGCVLQPWLLEDAGNSVNLTSPDGSVVYYSFPIEARDGYAVVNIGSWVNIGQYGLYYADGRLIGQLTITANSRGDLSCIVTQVPPEDETVICVGCGPRIEEFYLHPETGNMGRIIEINGVYYIESSQSFDGAAERQTPYGTVYYVYGAGGALEGSDIYLPCSVTVDLSQVTVNQDGTWTFIVLPMQWRSEWQLAAQRFGFDQAFVDAAMSTPVGSSFTVNAPQ